MKQPISLDKWVSEQRSFRQVFSVRRYSPVWHEVALALAILATCAIMLFL